MILQSNTSTHSRPSKTKTKTLANPASKVGGGLQAVCQLSPRTVPARKVPHAGCHEGLQVVRVGRCQALAYDTAHRPPHARPTPKELQERGEWEPPESGKGEGGGK